MKVGDATPPGIGVGLMGLAQGPHEEPTDPRFPPQLNAVIGMMAPEERDTFAPIYAEHAAWLESRQLDPQTAQARVEGHMYQRYITLHDHTDGPPATRTAFIEQQRREFEEARLDNFRAQTGQPHATAEQMYAASRRHQVEAIEEQLASLRQEVPNATLVDLYHGNLAAMRELFERQNAWSGPSLSAATPIPTEIGHQAPEKRTLVPRGSAIVVR